MKTLRKVNNKQMMHIRNYEHVLQLLAQGQTSRVRLAKLTGLTRAAVGNITGQMLADGIICETGNDEKDTSVGRKPILLSLRPEWGYIGCISIDRDEIAAGITDICGNLVGTPFCGEYCGDVAQTMDCLCTELQRQLQALPDADRVIGIGVIAPGPLDSEQGIILNAPSFKIWHDFPLKEEMEKRFSFPVFAEHNSIAITRAEKMQMQHKEYRNFAVYFINEGIGLGLVLDHRIFTGINGTGCEIGHTSIDMNGRLCSCGKRGCLEQYASIEAVLHDVARVDPTLRSWTQVVDRAVDGENRLCNEIMEIQAACLGHSILNLHNLLNLDAVILAGQATYRGAFLCNKVRRWVEDRQADEGEIPQIRLSRIKEYVALKGASAVVLNQFFHNELFLHSGLKI